MDIKRILVVGYNKLAIRQMTNMSITLPANIELAFLKKNKEIDFRFCKYFFNINEAKSWNPDAVIICCHHEKFFRDFEEKNIYITGEFENFWNNDKKKIFLIGKTPDGIKLDNDFYIEELLDFYERILKI